jgi:KAP family P-loop domain
MASASPTPLPSHAPGTGSGSGPQAGAYNLLQLTGVTVALGVICAIGLFDRSIRADPFTNSPSLWQWLSKPQPDPRLAIIPVLPMGPAGVLSWRPKSTQWIAEKSISQPQASPPRSAAEAFGLGSAHAGEIAPARPKIGGVELPDLKTGPSKVAPPNVQQFPPNVQQQPLNPQQLRPPDASKEPLKEIPKAPPPPPVVTTLVPNPAADARFSQLPTRVPLSPDAYWAACDLSGEFCSSVQGSEYHFSADGGQKWVVDVRRTNESPPLLVLPGQRNLVFSERTGQQPTGSSAALQDLIDFQLPFTLAEYGVGNQARGFRASTMDAAIERSAREYLRLTGAIGRHNFFGVLARPANDGSRGDNSGHTMFVLFSNGQALRTVLKPSDRIPGQIQHETTFTDVRSQANLRSLHFQPDQRIGWMSSGWNDGNEEGVYPAIFETTNGGDNWERLSYRARPAPWVLYAAMPAFIFAFFATGAAWRDSRAADQAKAGIADIGTSDSPIGWNDRDVLGLKPLALSLSRFIRNTNTAPPLTIAITGAWGTGKSSLMNLVAEDLRGRGANPVWFNAWHHQKEENILAALLENIRAQAIPSAWRFSGLAFRCRLLFSRIGANVFPLLLAIAILVTLAVTFDWHALTDNLLSWSKLKPEDIQGWFNHVAGVGVGAIVLVIIKVYGTLNLKPSELMATLRNNAKLADFSAQLSFRYKFAIEFNAAAQALRTSTNPGLVIFIDDLDRCAADNLMEVLESINFLTTAGPCFILLGMDEPKIIDIVAMKFGGDAARQSGGDPERARQYLKKLVNLTVPVPEVNEANSADLSAGPDPAAAAASPWPKRIRGALRTIPDACAPALGLIAVIWLLAAWLPPITAGDNAPTQPAQSLPAGPAPAADGAGQSVTPAPTRDNTAVPAIRIPTVTADRLVRHAQIQPYLGIGLALLIIIMLIARRVTTIREDKVEDSENFRVALAIWHPAVFAADPTPRGVKRHQNRLRLQAMRLRPLHDKPDVLDSWFSDAARSDAGDANTPDISEPKLVALGGIAALLRDIPDWSIQDGQSADTTGDAAAANRAAIVRRCREHFKKSFSHDWPPTQADIAAFRDLRQSL